MTKKLTELYTYTYKGKVQTVPVTVHINYVQGLISLMEYNTQTRTPVSAKIWKFTDRSIEYMSGWLDILDAMKAAITDAEEKLKAYQEQEKKDKEEKLIELAKLGI